MNSYLEIDNATLVDECKAGNQDALGMFYTRFAPKMYSVVMRYVSDPNDAKDILHDGFIVAFTRLGSIRTPDSVEYWLASIMKNLSLQFLQAQDVDKILHEIPEKEDVPEFEDIIDLTVLESLIQKLPRGYQTVFRLAVLENKTHKEIANILGIAPNSSSSQLFHAKMMMRKFIEEYRYKSGVLTLMLVALAAGFMWWHGTMDSEKQERVSNIAFVRPSINSNEEISINDHQEREILGDDTPPKKIAPAKSTQDTKTAIPDIPNQNLSFTPADTSEILPEAVSVSSDSTTIETYRDNISDDLLQSDLYALKQTHTVHQSARHSKWSLRIGVNTGSIAPCEFSNIDSDLRNELSPAPGDNMTPGETEEEEKRAPLRKSRKLGNEDFRNYPHDNDIPFTVSAMVSKSISRAVGLETGLSYTYLHSTLEIGTYSSDCRWHYLGIPLKLSFTNYSTRRVRLYATVGVQLDLPLYSSANALDSQSADYLPDGRFHSSVVASASVSYGLNINLSRHIGLFVEPTLQYHFEHEYNIPNAWTDDKLVFSLPVGLRYNF